MFTKLFLCDWADNLIEQNSKGKATQRHFSLVKRQCQYSKGMRNWRLNKLFLNKAGFPQQERGLPHGINEVLLESLASHDCFYGWNVLKQCGLLGKFLLQMLSTPWNYLLPPVWERLYFVLIAAFWREGYQCPNSWHKGSTANVPMWACAFDQGMGMWGFCSLREK